MGFLTKLPPSKDVLDEQMADLNAAQDNVIKKIQTKKRYNLDPCAVIDFTESSNIEFADDVFIQDLTTDEQRLAGINIFKVRVEKTATSPIHGHKNTTQLIHIMKGVIYDMTIDVKFEAGQSYFISKNNTHSIKYMEGTEILLIYIPGLETI